VKLAILYADIFNLISKVISRSFVFPFILQKKKKKTIKQIKPWDFFFVLVIFFNQLNANLKPQMDLLEALLCFLGVSN
jgi:hypothetical protein